MSFNSLKLKIIAALFILFLLVLLNINKFRELNNEVIPVWSQYDAEYYRSGVKEDLLTRIYDFLGPDQLIYRLTKIRIQAPITYLKREIPLLSYYTPEELKEEKNIVYQPDSNGGNVIKLKFDLRQEKRSEQITVEDLARKPRPEINVPSLREQPLIVLYHTHTSETYVDDPRHQDNNGHVLPGQIGNVGKVGLELARILSERYQFKVVHTTTVHDQVYSRSYYNSRKTVKELVNKYQKIDLLLDIHRDGIKVATRDTVTTVINGKKVAKVMIVVTNGRFDFAHLELDDHHQEWQRNLSFAQELAALMDKMYPGFLHRVEIRDTTYNQDLHPHALLLEIGDYRNTTEEAMRAAELVANVIAALFGHG